MTKVNIVAPKFLLVILFFSCSIIAEVSTETLKYKIIEEDGKKEIRLYEPYIKAQVEIPGTMEDSRGQAFKILAGFIFGKNTSKEKIKMTSPVLIEKSEKIDMTSPVIIDDRAGSKIKMSFSMPSKYTLKNLPTPNDPRIKIISVPERLVGAIKFSGRINVEKNKRKSKDLLKWLKKKNNYLVDPEYVYAGYNPPYTLPFMRRNEVIHELKLIENQQE